MTFHVMIIPTLNCPGQCEYCWGSEDNAELMDIEVIHQIVKWLDGFRDEKVHFTFHGGEPLLAGYDFYKEALPALAETNVEGFSLQSNLWLLTDEMAELFSSYGIAVSTSIDGPSEINDYQRGEGYFDKTMASVKLAMDYDMQINFVCTFTSYSKDFSDEIYDFFKSNGLNLKIHAALPSLRGDNADIWALPQEEHGRLLIEWLDKYLYDLDKFVIMDLDHIAKSCMRRVGTLCTFNDCMGNTLAVGADGSIYPCYRFVGMDEYIMGNVFDNPSMDDLMESDAWSKLMEFKDFVDEDCGDCRFVKFCRGGCPYNGIVATQSPRAVDPQCEAYKMIFGEVMKRANEDFKKNALAAFGGAPRVHLEGEAFSIMDLMMKR